MRKILIDSGPLIALFDRSDRYHKKSLEFIKNNKAELITTLASITETLHLLDFSHLAQIDFLSWVNQGAVEIPTIEPEDMLRIKILMIKYADLPMDFADACLVAVGEREQIDEVATIDRDFSIYRLGKNKPFKVVLK